MDGAGLGWAGLGQAGENLAWGRWAGRAGGGWLTGLADWAAGWAGGSWLGWAGIGLGERLGCGRLRGLRGLQSRMYAVTAYNFYLSCLEGFGFRGLGFRVSLLSHSQDNGISIFNL